MKKNILWLFSFLIFFNASAQKYSVDFLKGSHDFERNVECFRPSVIQENEVWNANYYRFVQFYEIPLESDKTKLSELGIELLEYVPNFTYIASIPTSLTQSDFAQSNIRSIQPIERVYRESQRIQDQNYPDWSRTERNTILLSLGLFDNVDFDEAVRNLQNEGVICSKLLPRANMIFLEVKPSGIDNLIAKPFVRYLDIAPEPGRPESDNGRFLHRANAIDGDFTGARNYDGTGINIAVNDQGFVGPHIDFTGRLNQDEIVFPAPGSHNNMVTGIIGGAGNLDPRIRGMATGSFIYIRLYDSWMPGTVPLHVDSNVLVFSTSYSNGCNAGYTLTTQLVDQEIKDYPNLMQVFSAGNANSTDCGYGAGHQWGNITGGHKMGKNVIAVANINTDDVIDVSSSRGPASDGRIKPDISAYGTGQMSTDPDNGYAAGSQTSAAAAGISGVFAQLHQAYSSLNGGQTAPSALLKATLLNTANDLGNEGPDFIYGWGKVNGLKAVKLLEDSRYLNANISHGGTNNHTIVVPAGVERVKVMVYWADYEASTSAATALVNDLDASLTDPSTAVHLPWVLDHTPSVASLALPATKGADHLNNMEQIEIVNPIAGNYDLEISGMMIPFGPQEYYVVYEFITSEITVIHPFGGEGLDPGVNERIHWDASGTLGDFTLEYTLDNGANWTTISNTVAGDDRFYTWTVPNASTGEARVRVTRGGDSDESDANFSIAARPENIRVSRVCQDVNTLFLEWDSVPGATEYDVFMLGSKFMDSIGTSASTNMNILVQDINDPQWFSVRTVGANGMRSTRQIAYYFSGLGNGNCFLSCYSDDDVGVSSLNEPVGNAYLCSVNYPIDVVISIENKGLNSVTGFPIYYQLDNGTVVSETYSNVLAPGGTALHSFGTPITFPSIGAYQLKTWTGLNTDSTFCNDTINASISVLGSIDNFPFAEDFETGFPLATAEIINTDDAFTWTGYNVTGASGAFTNTIGINNYYYDAPGQEDVIEFINFDLTQLQSPAEAFLTFDVAYRGYDASSIDQLRVDISNDCGQNFSQVYLKAGSTLATGINTNQSFIPTTAGEWRNDTIDLSSYIGGDVTVRFVNICGYGNNLFLDNINLDAQLLVNINELNEAYEMKIIPNPARGNTTLQFPRPIMEETTLKLTGMDGKVEFHVVLEKGSNTKIIDVSKLNSGVYLVYLTSSKQTVVRKIIVHD